MAAPTVSTAAVTAITGVTATGGGSVVSDGGKALTAYGVCWNTTGTPTVADSHTNEAANYYNAVTQGGIGSSTTTSAILNAITAYKNGGYDGLYFPAGTYAFSGNLNVPANTTIVGPTVSAVAYASGSGCQTPTAHLNGAVVYASGCHFNDLRIGTTNGNGIHNADAASYSYFTRCQFRGGGPSGDVWPVIFGLGNSCNHIYLADCNVEVTMGDNDNLYFDEWVGQASASHMEYVYFTGCHFGVSNGVSTISPRMNVELYDNPYPGTQFGIRHGWHHVEFRSCVFEPSTWASLNFPNAIVAGSPDSHDDTYSVVDTCTFYSGGANNAMNYGIACEGANFVTINNCDFYPSSNHVLSLLDFDAGVSTNARCHDYTITNNRFHLDDFSKVAISARDNDCAILLEGGPNSVFTGNTIHNSTGSYLLWRIGSWFDGCEANHWTVTGNHFHDLRVSNPNGIDSGGFADATYCTVTGNTFQVGWGSNPTFGYDGTNTGSTVITGSNNTLVHA